MKQLILLFVGCLVGLQWGLSQESLTGGQNNYDDGVKGIVYNKEFTVDFKLHTNGFALGFNSGRLKTYYLTRFYNMKSAN